jgi:ubiquinone biosynthesis protein UbiJ
MIRYFRKGGGRIFKEDLLTHEKSLVMSAIAELQEQNDEIIRLRRQVEDLNFKIRGLLKNAKPENEDYN